MNQVAAGVGVDRNEGHLLEQTGFRLGEDRVALVAGLRLRCATQDQVVKDGVRKARVVVAAARQEQVEEVVRVHVVADPATATDVVVLRRDGIEVHLPFLVGEFDVDVQVLLPHLLQGHGDLAVRLQGVVHDLGAGPALPVRVAGLGEEAPGLLGVEVDELRRLVAQGARGRDAPGGHHGVLHHRARQRFPVDGEGQGPAHAHVVEGRSIRVQQVVVGAEVRCLHIR